MNRKMLFNQEHRSTSGSVNFTKFEKGQMQTCQDDHIRDKPFYAEQINANAHNEADIFDYKMFDVHERYTLKNETSKAIEWPKICSVSPFPIKLSMNLNDTATRNESPCTNNIELVYIYGHTNSNLENLPDDDSKQSYSTRGFRSPLFRSNSSAESISIRDQISSRMSRLKQRFFSKSPIPGEEAGTSEKEGLMQRIRGKLTSPFSPANESVEPRSSLTMFGKLKRKLQALPFKNSSDENEHETHEKRFVPALWRNFSLSPKRGTNEMEQKERPNYIGEFKQKLSNYLSPLRKYKDNAPDDGLNQDTQDMRQIADSGNRTTRLDKFLRRLPISFGKKQHSGVAQWNTGLHPERREQLIAARSTSQTSPRSTSPKEPPSIAMRLQQKEAENTHPSLNRKPKRRRTPPTSAVQAPIANAELRLREPDFPTVNASPTRTSVQYTRTSEPSLSYGINYPSQLKLPHGVVLDDYSADFSVPDQATEVDDAMNQLRDNALTLIKMEQAQRLKRLQEGHSRTKEKQDRSSKKRKKSKTPGYKEKDPVTRNVEQPPLELKTLEPALGERTKDISKSPLTGADLEEKPLQKISFKSPADPEVLPEHRHLPPSTEVHMQQEPSGFFTSGNDQLAVLSDINLEPKDLDQSMVSKPDKHTIDEAPSITALSNAEPTIDIYLPQNTYAEFSVDAGHFVNLNDTVSKGLNKLEKNQMMFRITAPKMEDMVFNETPGQHATMDAIVQTPVLFSISPVEEDMSRKISPALTVSSPSTAHKPTERKKGKSRGSSRKTSPGKRIVNLNVVQPTNTEEAILLDTPEPTPTDVMSPDDEKQQNQLENQHEAALRHGDEVRDTSDVTYQIAEHDEATYDGTISVADSLIRPQQPEATDFKVTSIGKHSAGDRLEVLGKPDIKRITIQSKKPVKSVSIVKNSAAKQMQFLDQADHEKPSSSGVTQQTQTSTQSESPSVQTEKKRHKKSKKKSSSNDRKSRREHRRRKRSSEETGSERLAGRSSESAQSVPPSSKHQIHLYPNNKQIITISWEEGKYPELSVRDCSPNRKAVTSRTDENSLAVSTEDKSISESSTNQYYDSMPYSIDKPYLEDETAMLTRGHLDKVSTRHRHRSIHEARRSRSVTPTTLELLHLSGDLKYLSTQLVCHALQDQSRRRLLIKHAIAKCMLRELCRGHRR